MPGRVSDVGASTSAPSLGRGRFRDDRIEHRKLFAISKLVESLGKALQGTADRKRGEEEKEELAAAAEAERQNVFLSGQDTIGADRELAGRLFGGDIPELVETGFAQREQDITVQEQERIETLARVRLADVVRATGTGGDDVRTSGQIRAGAASVDATEEELSGALRRGKATRKAERVGKRREGRQETRADDLKRKQELEDEITKINEREEARARNRPPPVEKKLTAGATLESALTNDALVRIRSGELQIKDIDIDKDFKPEKEGGPSVRDRFVLKQTFDLVTAIVNNFGDVPGGEEIAKIAAQVGKQYDSLVGAVQESGAASVPGGVTTPDEGIIRPAPQLPVPVEGEVATENALLAKAASGADMTPDEIRQIEALLARQR